MHQYQDDEAQRDDYVTDQVVDPTRGEVDWRDVPTTRRLVTNEGLFLLHAVCSGRGLASLPVAEISSPQTSPPSTS
ncbi:MAG: hypothetical protein AAGF11_41165 [Myxococcota bacterium]